MKILVIGGGGREHAIIKKLKENKKVTQIFALPGNGGIAADAVCVNNGIADTDAEKIAAFALENKIDYVVVAPDNPLIAGVVDALERVGIPAFGPNAAAAQIEGSKIFAKNLMKKYGIPTAAYEIFDNAADALAYIEGSPLPIVIKADGPALGKGVIIAATRPEARDAVASIMTDKKFGDSGSRIVIEEYLSGPEVSVLAFTDGKTIVPMISSMDHKRALDGDRGLNTGGMGTIAPNPFYTPNIAQVCMEKIFLPTINAMNKEGRPFKGCLYFGLMLTKKGPYVIEYNCRFGDPETQVVLPLLKTDLLTIMTAVTEERLSSVPVEFDNSHAACIIMASDGYPQAYKSGLEIKADPSCRDYIYYAGAKQQADGKLYTAGGRVLGVIAVADTLREALDTAYGRVGLISFENAHYRHDIGARALEAEPINS